MLWASPVIDGAAQRLCTSGRLCPPLGGFMQEPGRMEGCKGRGHQGAGTSIPSAAPNNASVYSDGEVGCRPGMNRGLHTEFFKHMEEWTKNNDP